MFCIRKTMQFKNIHYFKLTPTISTISKHQHITYSNTYTLSTKKSIGKFKHKNDQRIYDFHTTSKLYIRPMFAMLIRPILRISAIVIGKSFKLWWRKQSDEDKKIYKELFKRNVHIFLGSLGILCLTCIIYYIMHIETDPITKRKRFILFNKEEQAAFGKLMYGMHMSLHKDSILKKDHPAYEKVGKIVRNLIISNGDLIPADKRTWSLTIIDSPIGNSYVIPGRNIFFFLGALTMVDNDDQLAFILAHEMAHALLSHAIEQYSNAMKLEVLLLIPFLMLFAYFPDIVAIFFYVVIEYLMMILYNLPYSRALENEADDVGLKLAAKACVDVREAVVFWASMRTLSEIKLEKDVVPWLSTHPAHGDREQSLNKKLPQALELMKSSGCSPLHPTDPRKKFYERTQRDHETYFKHKGVF